MPGKVVWSSQLEVAIYENGKWRQKPCSCSVPAGKLVPGDGSNPEHSVHASSVFTLCLGLPPVGRAKYPSVSSAKSVDKCENVTKSNRYQNGLFKPRSTGLRRHYWKMVSTLMTGVCVTDCSLLQVPSPPASCDCATLTALMTGVCVTDCSLLQVPSPPASCDCATLTALMTGVCVTDCSLLQVPSPPASCDCATLTALMTGVCDGLLPPSSSFSTCLL